MYKLKLLCIPFLFFACLKLNGQVFYINGGVFFGGTSSVSVSNGGIYCQTGSDLHLNGILWITKNSTLSLNGNLIIASGAALSNSGTLYIEQDILNDGVFSNSSSVVELNGNTNQTISSNNGSAITFHNLLLTGNGVQKLKECINVDILISNTGSLVLNDRILHSHSQTVQVLNPSESAVTNSNFGFGIGFVASDIGGYLEWKGNATQNYLAPCGSINPTELYRPIYYSPTSDDFYKIRLDQHTPSQDGFDVNNHSEEICNINELFYHRFISENGNTANFKLSFNPNTDGNWVGVAEYTSLWQPTGINNTSVQLGLNWISVNANEYETSEESFALSTPGPVAYFNVSPLDLFFNQVQFTDYSTGASSWSWDFSDNTTSTEQNPFHPFYPGDYEIILTVTNEFGCDDTASTWVHSNGELKIPNIFSPDADGLNDLLEIQVPSVESFHLIILNRWGSRLFESFDRYNLWDGTFAGHECSEGTYFMIIELKQGNYQEQIEESVLLVRKQ